MVLNTLYRGCGRVVSLKTNNNDKETKRKFANLSSLTHAHAHAVAASTVCVHVVVGADGCLLLITTVS